MQNWAKQVGEYFYDLSGRNVMPTFVPSPPPPPAIGQMAGRLLKALLRRLPGGLWVAAPPPIGGITTIISRNPPPRRGVLMSRIQVLLRVLLVSFTAVGLAACDPASDRYETPAYPPEVGGVPTDQDIIAELREWAQTWLAGLAGPAGKPLPCPGQLPHARILASGPDARGCLWLAPNGQVVARVQNLSRVPMSVLFRTTWATLDPGAIEDYPLVDPQFRQNIRYQPNLPAAVARATIDYVRARTQPLSVAWNECVAQLEAGCILSALERLLPAEVKFRQVRIPLGRIVQVLNQVWTYKPLVEAYAQRAAPPGTLTFVPVA